MTYTNVRGPGLALNRGVRGLKGDKPDHRWFGPILEFQEPDGSWGDGANLVGPEGPTGSEQNFPTGLSITGTNVSSTVQYIRTSGYSTIADGGAALYRRVGTEPTHPGKFQSADGAWWALSVLPEQFDVRMVGGGDDGTRNNANALLAFIGLFGRSNATLRLPRVSSGVYLFGGSPDFTGIALAPDRGVRVAGTVFTADGALVPSRKLDIAFTGGGRSYPITVTPDVDISAAEKRQWITGGDLDHTKAYTLPVNSGVAETVAIGNSDAFANDATAAVTADTATWNLTADNLWHCVTWPARGGREFNCAFPAVADYHRGIVVKGTNGYAMVTALYGTSGTLRYKVRGQAAVNVSGIEWPGRATHESYYPGRVMWTIRVISNSRIAVLVNGTEAVSYYDISHIGDIEAAGFVVAQGGTNASGVQLAQTSRVDRKFGTGKGNIRLLIVGDSKSAAFPGAWPKLVRNHLEYSFGAQVEKLTNYAVSGDHSGQQRAKLEAEGLGDATHVVIAVGTNDVQGGAVLADTVGNLGLMIDQVLAGGRRPLLVVFEPWYPISLNPLGQGESPSRYQEGAPFRAAMVKLAGQKGIPHVDMQQCLPAILGNYVSPSFGARDIILRDNIHQTQLGYHVYAWHIARALAGDMCPVMSPRVAEKALHTNGLASGWTMGSVPFTYAVSDDGRAVLSGSLAAGTKADGTVVYRLPRNLRPKQSKRWLCTSDGAANPIVLCRSTGEVEVYGLGSANLLWFETSPFELA